MSRGFFDASAGQPLNPTARHALEAVSDRLWADPQAPYHEGRRARQLLDAARQTVAGILRVEPGSVAFRHGQRDVATQAVVGVARGQVHVTQSRSVVTSAVERQVVLDAADNATAGPAIRVAVGPTGAVDLPALESALDRQPMIACIQAANNEIGTRQPLESVAAACERAKVPLVVDGTGSLGFDEPPAVWNALFADALSWGGPRDIGILAVRPGTRWRSIDAFNDSARPADVSDLAGAVGAAAALEAVEADRATEAARLRILIDRIRAEVLNRIPDVQVIGDPTDRLPHVLTFSCLYVDGQVVADELDRLGFAVGSGSACTTETGLASHVLVATGSLSHGNVRLTLPLGCPPADVDRLLATLPGVIARNREALGLPSS